MDTTELGVSILLKSWLWCLVAVLTACILEQWISLALLGWFFVVNYSQRSSRCFSFMLPRFNTKDRIILLITELKTKPNKKNSNKQKQRKDETSLAHQVLALITDKTLRYFGLQDESLSEASSWLSCEPDIKWSPNQYEFLCCLNCHVNYRETCCE